MAARLVMLLAGFACAGVSTGCSDESSPGVVGPKLDASPCPAPFTLFLNRHETTYTPGRDNSVANVSSLVGDTVTAAGFPYSDAVWTETVQRVRGKFAAYNLEVVDVEPEVGPYFETMVTGSTPSDFGLSEQPPVIWHIGGSSLCEASPLGIAFVFASGPGADPEALAHTAAHASAFSMGVSNHVIADGHVMRFLWDETETAFLDERVPCGAAEPTECFCSGSATTNTHAILLANLGAACSAE